VKLKLIGKIVIIVFFLTACNPPTTSPTSTKTPQDTPTVSTSTTTAQPTATLESISYEIPEWLQDTKGNVLLYFPDPGNFPYRNHLITFLEPETGNTYEIDYYMVFRLAYWFDNQRVAFLSGEYCSPFSYVSILDLSTGLVTKYWPEELANDDFCPYQNPTYSVSVDRTEENPIKIYYWEAEEWDKFSPQEPGTLNLYAQLSPNDSILVVLQNTNGSYKFGNRFAIFDFSSRQQIATFYDTDINTFFRFFQDSKRIVYLKGNTPCILTLETLEKECGQTIPEFHESIYLGGLTQDESKIIFISDNMENVKRICIEDLSTDIKRCDLIEIEGGLCLFDIFNGELQCPTSGFDGVLSKTSIIDNSLGLTHPVTHQYSVIRYVFSPDEKFFVFTYGRGCPACHAFNKLFRAVISTDGSVYYDLGEHNHIFVWAEWRPAP
jgi:hypothetical protein